MCESQKYIHVLHKETHGWRIYSPIKDDFSTCVIYPFQILASGTIFFTRADGSKEQQQNDVIFPWALATQRWSICGIYIHRVSFVIMLKKPSPWTLPSPNHCKSPIWKSVMWNFSASVKQNVLMNWCQVFRKMFGKSWKSGFISYKVDPPKKNLSTPWKSVHILFAQTSTILTLLTMPFLDITRPIKKNFVFQPKLFVFSRRVFLNTSSFDTTLPF